MSDGVKIALIVGGSAVGAFVLLKALAPSAPPVTSKPKSNTDFLSIQGLAGLGTMIAGAFGRGGSPAASSGPTVPANFDTNNYSVNEGFMFTDASGNFIAG